MGKTLAEKLEEIKDLDCGEWPEKCVRAEHKLGLVQNELEIYKIRLSQMVSFVSVLQAIEDEEEFPGEIPDEMYRMLLNADKQTMVEALRIVVRLTKQGIRDRIIGGRN